MLTHLKDLLQILAALSIIVGCRQSGEIRKTLKNKAQDKAILSRSETSDIKISEDSSSKEIVILISGLSAPSASCDSTYLNYTSSNFSLVPEQNAVTWGGVWPNCTAVISPVVNANGSAVVEIIAHDGKTSVVVKSINLTSEPINDAPALAPFSSSQIQSTKNTPTSPINVFISDADGPNQTCSANYLSYKSSNSAVVADSGAITWGGTWPECTAVVQPVADAIGDTSISVTVSDGDLVSGAMSFDLSVVIKTPTILDVQNQSTSEDVALNNVQVVIGDGENAVSCATSLTAQSSNTSLLPVANIAITGTAPNCAIGLTPLANANGQSTVTLNVTDGISNVQDSFVLTVTPAFDAPALVVVDSQSTVSNISTAIALGLNNPDGYLFSCASTHISYISSNTSLVPATGALVLSGSFPSSCVATITPAQDAYGVSQISFTLDNGTYHDSKTVLLTVTPSPRLVGSVALNSGASTPGWSTLNLQGTKAYALGYRLAIFDVQNWSNITELSNIPMLTTWTGTDSELIGTTLYATHDGLGIRPIDVSNPASPVSNPSSAWGGYTLALQAKERPGFDPIIFGASFHAGMRFSVIPTTGGAITSFGSATYAPCDNWNGYTVALQDSILGSGDAGGFQLYSVVYNTPPAAPTVTRTACYGQSEVRGIAFSPDANYAYLAANGGGLAVIDITNKFALAKVGSYTFSTGSSYAVTRYATNRIVVGNSDKLHFFDVSNPTLPKLLYSYVLTGNQGLRNWSKIKLSSDGILSFVDQSSTNTNVGKFLKPVNFVHMGSTNVTTALNTPTTVSLPAHFIAGGLQSDLSYVVVAAPSKGTLGTLPDVPATGTANLNYAPMTGLSGSDSFIYKICNSSSVCTESILVSITITP
ncbi:MAG: hypothetical protein WCI18_13465 [Pseudomonadota bacterium]